MFLRTDICLPAKQVHSFWYIFFFKCLAFHFCCIVSLRNILSKSDRLTHKRSLVKLTVFIKLLVIINLLCIYLTYILKDRFSVNSLTSWNCRVFVKDYKGNIIISIHTIYHEFLMFLPYLIEHILNGHILPCLTEWCNILLIERLFLFLST